MLILLFVLILGIYIYLVS